MTYVPAERFALEDPVAVLPHVNPPVTLLSTEPQRFLEATVMLPRFRRTLSRAVVVEFVGEALSRLTFCWPANHHALCDPTLCSRT